MKNNNCECRFLDNHGVYCKQEKQTNLNFNVMLVSAIWADSENLPSNTRTRNLKHKQALYDLVSSHPAPPYCRDLKGKLPIKNIFKIYFYKRFSYPTLCPQ